MFRVIRLRVRFRFKVIVRTMARFRLGLSFRVKFRVMVRLTLR